MHLKPSGIDIDLGNKCSRIAYGYAKKTFANRPPGSGNPLVSADGGFANIMDFGGVKIGMSSDGIGTKIELAERTGIYKTLGYDLIAMVADDLAANGIETVNLSNILDVDNLDADIVEELMQGLKEAADFSRIAITGGEIAELGNRIGGYGNGMHFNWGATGIGILPQDKEIVDGRHIAAGDTVLALKSRGFRSNGFSLLRKIMQEQFGEDWHNAAYDDETGWGEKLLTPSLIYSPFISKLIQNDVQLKGCVHITGGGIADNLSRILKINRLGAELNDLFEPLPVMKKIQEMGAVAEEQAYRLWNMGNGMLLIADATQISKITELAARHDYRAKICGRIVAGPNIKIDTRGRHPQRLLTSY